MRIQTQNLSSLFIKTQLSLLRLLIAAGTAAFLFAILHLTRNILELKTGTDNHPEKTPIMVMQQIHKEEKKSHQPLQPMRTVSTGTFKESNRNTGFSMRFTPDLSVGTSGDGVGMISSGGGGDAVFDEHSIDEPPRPISRQSVEYPRRAKEAGIEGSVSLILFIGREGNVIDITVESSSSPLFVKAVQQAVKQWKFIPGRNQGVPVQVRMRQKIVFNLDS